MGLRAHGPLLLRSSRAANEQETFRDALMELEDEWQANGYSVNDSEMSALGDVRDKLDSLESNLKSYASQMEASTFFFDLFPSFLEECIATQLCQFRGATHMSLR